MCDLFDEKVFEQKLRRVASGYQKRFGDLLKYDVEEEIARYKVISPAYKMICLGTDMSL
jgi:adenylosuccinate synthase